MFQGREAITAEYGRLFCNRFQYHKQNEYDPDVYLPTWLGERIDSYLCFDIQECIDGIVVFLEEKDCAIIGFNKDTKGITTILIKAYNTPAAVFCSSCSL